MCRHQQQTVVIILGQSQSFFLFFLSFFSGTKTEIVTSYFGPWTSAPKDSVLRWCEGEQKHPAEQLLSGTQDISLKTFLSAQDR